MANDNTEQPGATTNAELPADTLRSANLLTHDVPVVPPPSDERLAPPASSKATMVLNGMGNGMMLGAIPFVGFNLYRDITKHYRGKPEYELPKSLVFANYILTGIGCVFGTIHGMREGQHLENYRHALGNEIVAMRHKVNDQEASVRDWQSKLAEQAGQTAEKQAARG